MTNMSKLEWETKPEKNETNDIPCEFGAWMIWKQNLKQQEIMQ